MEFVPNYHREDAPTLPCHLFTEKHLELMWLSPVAAWINILSMFLIFCIVLWVIDQYQGGLGLPIQENIDLLSEELKLKLLIVSP